MDRFYELALQPRCLLAVSALEGRPTYFSQLRSNELRNFEVRGQFWEELTEKIKAVGTADFKLSLGFKAFPNSTNISRSLVLCTTWSSNERCCVSYWQNDPQSRLRISILGLYDDGEPDDYIDVPGFTLEDAVEAEIIIERKTSELIVTMSGVEIYNKVRSNPAKLSFALNDVQDQLRSAFNGGLNFLRFESGSSIWEASLSSLRTGQIRPYNFKIARSWNFNQWLPIGTDDFEFFIEFAVDEETPEVRIFSSDGAEGTINLIWNGETKQSSISFKLFEGDSWIFNFPKLMELGSHSVRVTRRGLVGEVEVDGEVAQTWGGEIAKPLFAAATSSLFAGSISKLYFKNLTSGAAVWSASKAELFEELPLWPAPEKVSESLSPAENAGLLKVVNFKADSGTFKAERASVISRIQTRLDFRNRRDAFTVAAKAYFPWLANDSKLHFYPLISQGDVLSNFGGDKVFGLYALADFRKYQAIYSLEIAVGLFSNEQQSLSVSLTPSFFNKRHLIAASFVPLGGYSFCLRLFVDGEFQAEQNFEGSIAQLGLAPTADLEQCNPDGVYVFNSAYGNCLVEGYEADFCLIFEGALLPEEVAALSTEQIHVNSLLGGNSKFVWIVPN